MYDGDNRHTAMMKPAPTHSQERCSASLHIDALLRFGCARARSGDKTPHQFRVFFNKAQPAQMVERLHSHRQNDLEVTISDDLHNPLHTALGLVIGD